MNGKDKQTPTTNCNERTTKNKKKAQKTNHRHTNIYIFIAKDAHVFFHMDTLINFKYRRKTTHASQLKSNTPQQESIVNTLMTTTTSTRTK